MSKFVEAFGSERTGFPRINLDHVAELRPVQENRKTVAYDACAPNGEVLGRISAHDAEQATRPRNIVPDTTGTVLVTFWPDDCPYEAGAPIWCARYPVIGWEVVDGGAEPITCEYFGSSSPWCLEHRADGKPYSWLFLEDCSCDSFEEAKRYAMKKLAPAAETAA